MRRALKLGALLSAAFMGGFAAQCLFPGQSALAAATRILQADQLWIYASDRKHRIQMGTYPGEGEKGQPLIGLSDSRGGLRLLARLQGPNETPVLVFKDGAGQDRMVIGLDESSETPYIRK